MHTGWYDRTEASKDNLWYWSALKRWIAYMIAYFRSLKVIFQSVLVYRLLITSDVQVDFVPDFIFQRITYIMQLIVIFIFKRVIYICNYAAAISRSGV